MKSIILFGKPGAGKGTQATCLEKQYNLYNVSTGYIFRYNLKNESELGKNAKTYIDRGELDPDEITINMLKEEVKKNMDKTGFLFDGFPRTIAQAEALDNFLKELN